MKTSLFIHPIRRVTLTFIMAMMGVIGIYADGEQREEKGAIWVDPVEHFKLQDITTHDFKRDYDQGDIDFNEVLKKSGAKVYGLRLKPIAIAGHVDGIEPIGTLRDINYTINYDYHDIMGIRGAPLNEASFCIYFDGAVNRTYNGSYTYDEHVVFTKAKASPTDHKMRVQMNMSITGLRLVPSYGGIAFSYAVTASGLEKGYGRTLLDGRDISAVDNGQKLKASKEMGEDEKLGHFIYQEGSSHLLVMLGANQLDNYTLYLEYLKEYKDILKPLSAKQREYLSRPWARIYFEVEEIMVNGDAVVALSATDKEELNNYVQDLATWLRGDGDPLGLGEHTDAKTALVIGAISTVTSILLSGGAAAFIGSTGAEIAGNMTNAILEGSSGESVPPISESETIDGLEPKRREEEENGAPPAPDPYDGKLFKPSAYPGLCSKYIKESADGTMTFTSPVTGQKTEYYPTEDGQWVKCYGANETKYTSEELEERLRYEAENVSTLRQDAATAARNQAEQRALWDAQNERDRERGYSDEMKDYQDWKKEQEQAIKREEYIDKLATKYNTTVDKLKDAISSQQRLAEEEAFYQLEVAKQWDSALKMAETVDKVCETTVNIMGECVPGGRLVKNVYTFTKATAVALSESIAEGKSLGETAAHVAVGMGSGALGVIQNQAGDLTKNPFKEMAIVVGTESIKEGMSTYAKDGDVTKALNAMLSSGAKKSVDFVTGKAINAGMGFIKDSAAQTLNPKLANIDTDTGLRFSDKTATTIDKWLNNPLKVTGDTNMKLINFTNADGNLVMPSIQNFNFKGEIDVGSFITTAIPEGLNRMDAHDWAGNLAVGLKDDLVQFGSDLNTLYNRATQFKN